MPIKSHSFSKNLMVNSAIEDAVLNDAMLINEFMLKPKEEAIELLSSHFNLKASYAKIIVDKQLSLALFEASTLVNKDVTDFEKIQSLSEYSSSNKGQRLIKKMIDKYELLIELFARKASATANPFLFQIIGSSKRTSKAVKQILEEQIEIARSKMSTNYINNNPKVKQLRLARLEETFEKVAPGIDHKSSFIQLEALIKVADESGQYINKIDQATSEKIFDLVKQTQQGHNSYDRAY